MSNKHKIFVGMSIIFLICCMIFLPYYIGTVKSNPKNERKFYEKNGTVVWDAPNSKKVIALTFDDGPNKKYTPLVLDLLKQFKVKATFFLVGSCVKSNPDLVKKIFKNGHELANHTATHPDLRKTSLSQLQKEIETTRHEIVKITGYSTKYFRPAGGVYNQGIVDISQKTKHKIILWSWDQDTLDWTKPNHTQIAQKVIKNASGGDIVLMHDNQIQTVNALKIFLPKLKDMGYTFVTISELLKLKK